MKYDYLIGKIIDIKNNDNDNVRCVEITEELLDKAVSRLLTFRRKSRKDFESSDDFIIEQYVTEDDVFINLRSASNLKEKTPDISVKFDDVRNMGLGLDLLEGYKDAEKQFVQARLIALSEDFNLEKTTDKFLGWRVALCELKIMQLETLSAMNRKEFIHLAGDKQIAELDRQYKVFCESLNVLKRQRDNTKAKPEEKMDLTGNINKLDKSNAELQKEVDKARLEEKVMLEKLHSKKR